MLSFTQQPSWMPQILWSLNFWGSTGPIATRANHKKFNLFYPVSTICPPSQILEFSLSSPWSGGIPASYTSAEMSSTVGLIRIQLAQSYFTTSLSVLVGNVTRSSDTGSTAMRIKHRLLLATSRDTGQGCLPPETTRKGSALTIKSFICNSGL